MSLLLDAPPEQGAQEPRVSSWPKYRTTTGDEAIDLCDLAGLYLDPWQQFVLRHSLGERPDGKWSAFEVGLCVPRQNGKGSLIVARELVGLFLLGERLIIHSAHQQDTSLEGLKRLEQYIRDTPELHERVKAYRHSNGTEGIELETGSRISFRTRTGGGGRGFTADCLILDEAMFLPEDTIAALLPTLSSRPNPQLWYTGSAVDQLSHRDGIVFARVRERGAAGTDKSLAYFEWSADLDIDKMTREDTTDPVHWAEANPAMGFRPGLSPDQINRERAGMSVRTFAVERLGVGDWPKTDGTAAKALDPVAWEDGQSEESVAFTAYAFDVPPDRSFACIAGAGSWGDDWWGVHPVARERGTGWVVDYLTDLAPDVLVCDGRSPAHSLVPELERAGLTVITATTQELAEACGVFYDAVDQRLLLHDSVDLDNAVDGANTRPLGDAFAWARRTSTADISPLVACTLALWAAQTRPSGTPDIHDLTEIVERLRRERAK